MNAQRWLIIPLALLITFAVGAQGCKGSAPMPAAESTGTVQLVDEYVAAWNAHDAAKAASYFADDVEYYDASTAEPQVGKANAQKNVIEAFMTAVPDAVWKRDPSPPVVGKDAIAFQWTYSGTNTGPWADGTAATSKPFSIRGLTLIRIKDGKIAYQGDYYDAYGFYKQLGLAE